jgi:hypothetical protein
MDPTKSENRPTLVYCWSQTLLPQRKYFQKFWLQFWFQNRVQVLVRKMDLVLNMGLVPEIRPGSSSVFTKRNQNSQFYPVKPGNHPTLVSTKLKGRANKREQK